MNHYQPIFSSIVLNLVSSSVPAGFPSPAEDYVEGKLDLTALLVQHPGATFYVRVQGESMLGDGIHDKDILVVDRSLEARQGDVVIAALHGEFTVKRLMFRLGQPWLVPSHPAHQAVQITADMDSLIWGVVTSVIHQFRR